MERHPYEQGGGSAAYSTKLLAGLRSGYGCPIVVNISDTT
jgi:hypothetical protein